MLPSRGCERAEMGDIAGHKKDERSLTSKIDEKGFFRYKNNCLARG